MRVRLFTCVHVCLNFQNHLGIFISLSGIQKLMLEVEGQASGSLGETILFVQLGESQQEDSVSSKSHKVGTRGMPLCFWFPLSFQLRPRTAK